MAGIEEFVPEYHYTPGVSPGSADASRRRQVVRTAAFGQALAPTFSGCSHSVVTSSGSPTTLQCFIEADPSPTVQWFHNREECTDANKFCMLRDGSWWCLFVKDTNIDDCGHYRVLASNLHGSQDFTFLVTVLNPLPPSK